ncbi:YigZ family protein [Denitrificimonas sp. JX-1]|uniref:YigZ family protein n=1 Tax=Denitrificimonas halotolerans TaxID=3098930 RepID=A0ABU5GN37_9GAMM|nr:YigZ family protein [Denitrificimonas sp. JX-1]MDY7218348.1 YigZ family protein [Denitrificimonas sp. JX-1]
MRVLKAPHSYEEEIRKSRFLAQAVFLSHADQAAALIARLSVPNVSHNCWAWRCGEQYRFNDDGEPSGTAGRPILAAIENQKFDQVLIVVTRWYGGIQLGTGGLARAYGGCATQVLQTASSELFIQRTTLSGHCPYTYLDVFKVRIAEVGGVLNSETFDAEGAWLNFAVPDEQVEVLQHALKEATRGVSQLQPIKSD